MIKDRSSGTTTWHYGLVARWWAEFNHAEPHEIDFFGGMIRRYGEPALDLACGTGRLLLPLLEQGLDVDGCDVSPDMIAECRRQAEEQSLAPDLFVQAVADLDPPRAYRTIYMCGAFGLGDDRGGDIEGLRRSFKALEPGGALVFDHYLPYESSRVWTYWLPEHQEDLPKPWPDQGDRGRCANGEEIELRSRLVALDPLEQRLTRQMRARLYRDGQIVREEENDLMENLYFRNEVLLLLQHAGFGMVDVHQAYSELGATAKSKVIAFVAQKPSPTKV